MDSIFNDDPKITITFEHAFIEASVTLKVRVKDYPMIFQHGQEPSAQVRDIYSAAVAASAQNIANAIVQAHAAFEESFHKAHADFRFSQLKSSQSTT